MASWYSRSNIQKLMDPRNLGLYVFILIVLAITWSGMKTIQSNYELQKKISVLKQQNEVLGLENENTKLQNQYFNTDQYLDLAARQDLGLAAPGEQVILVPKNVALKYVDSSLSPKAASTAAGAATQSKYIKNLEDWRDFLLGRKLTSN